MSSVAEPGDYVKYTPPSTTFGMTVSDTGALVNNLSTQRFTTSNYTGLWQVLYNDSTHGLELISANSVATLTLGTAGSSSNSKIAYNKCVQTLNTFSSYYVNTTYATRGRSVGSNPTNPNGTTSLYSNSQYGFISKYASDFITQDTYYTYDINAMNSANITSIGSNYWMASRMIAVIDWGADRGSSYRYNFSGRIRRVNSSTATITDIISVSGRGSTGSVDTASESKDSEIQVPDEEPDDESMLEPGSVILTSGGVASGVISEAKLNREQIRAKNTENLTNIVNDANLDKSSKTAAVNELAKIFRKGNGN